LRSIDASSLDHLASHWFSQSYNKPHLYYSDISILEAMWKVVKIVRGAEDEILQIAEGITAIRETIEHAPIDGGC